MERESDTARLTFGEETASGWWTLETAHLPGMANDQKFTSSFRCKRRRQIVTGRLRALVSGSKAHHVVLGKCPADDLQADWHAVISEARTNRARGLSGQIERIGVIDPRHQ